MKLSNGKTLSPEELTKALQTVSADMVKLAEAIYKEDAYASHVTAATKKSILGKALVYASDVGKGLHTNNFTIWQRVDYLITGKSIALLP